MQDNIINRIIVCQFLFIKIHKESIIAVVLEITIVITARVIRDWDLTVDD